MTIYTVRPAADDRRDAVHHILLGLGITAAAVAGAALVARMQAHADAAPDTYSDYDDKTASPTKPVSTTMSLLWTPLFMALTVSGLRIWSAPRSPARTQALTLWGVAQGLNTAWMALGPARLGGRLTAAVASLGTASAFAWRAGQVDAKGAKVVAPYAGWMGIANVLSDSLRRRGVEAAPTVH